ncbi:hypothetical protein BC936DRAFT_140264, partial [Jimgerdemannia flammicorona]
MSPLSSYKPKPNLCIGTATLLTQPPRHKGHPAGNPEADNNDATLHDMDGNVQQLMQSLEESITANWKKNHHSHSHPHPRHHPTAAETTYRPYYGSYHPTLSQSRAASPTPSVEDASPTVAEGHHEQEDGRISPPSPFDYTPSPGVQGKPIAHHRRALKDQYDVVESRAGFFDMTVFDIASLSDRDARRAVFSGDDSGPDRVESASESEDDRAGPAAGKRRSRNRRVAAELSLSTIADDPETRLSPHPTLHHTESIEPVQLPSEKQEIEPAEDQILTEANTPKTETPTTTHKEKKPLSHFNRLLDPLIAHIHKTLPQRVQRRLHKVVVAWFLTILVCLIHPIQEWVGPVSYLATTAIVFFHPARTLGAQIEATIMGLLGTLAGMIMSWAGLAASTAYNSAHLEKGDKGGRAILAAFLFVSVFVVTWARGRYPRWISHHVTILIQSRFFLFGVMSAILTIFTFTKSVDLTTFSTTSILDFARPLFLGAVLSLLVNLILWRESASQGLGRALNESLTEIRTLLDLTTSAFLLDPARLDLPNSAVDDVSARMRQALAKVLTAYGEARYEISYGYARGTDFKDIKKCVSRLTQHLSSLALSLHNEKFLLEARKASVAVPKGLRNLSEGESDEEEEEDQEKEVMRRTVRAIETLKEKRDREEIDEDDDSRPQTRESHRDRSRSGRSTPQPLASATGSESEDNEYEKGEKSEKEQAEAEEDFQQSTVHSIRSMLSLSRLFHPSELRSGESTPNPGAGRKSGRDTPSKRISMEQHRIPPKPAKEIVYGDKELLITYLMGVKGPLVELTTVCEETLEAVRKELGEELDIGQELIEGPKKEKENGANIKDGKKEEGKKRWWTRAWLSIGALGKRKTNINNTATSSTTLTDPQASQPNAPTTVPVGRRPLPDYARQISTAVISFDLHEQAHLVRLRRDPAFLAGIIDLGPREELFLVFFFMFSLREVARELRNLADSLRMVKMKNGVVEEEEEREGGSGSVDRVMRKRRKRVFLPKINFRKWVMGTNHSTVQDKGGNSVVHFEDEPRRVEPLYSGDHDVNLALTRSRSLHPVHPDSQPADVPSRPIHRLHTPPAAKSVSFAPPPSDLESLSPLKPPLSIRIRYVLWCQLHRFTAYEVKFGLKMAVAITFLSSLAYFDATMDQFALDRGQWACISILVVMNPAVGGTVNTGFARIIGTIAGAVWGMAAWAIDGPNPYVLAVMGLIMGKVIFYPAILIIPPFHNICLFHRKHFQPTHY